MNKVTLVGRLTKTPEFKTTSNGTGVTQFSIAVNRPYKENGETQADFINCIAWRERAQFICNYLKKGFLIGINGTLQTRTFQDQSGQTRYVTEVLVENVENYQPREKEQQDQPYSDDLPF